MKFHRQREEMVLRQIEARGVTDPKVLAAMRKVRAICLSARR